jgi:hypothetical protein
LDLILYAEVCRRHGLAVYGPPAGQVFAQVPQARLVRAVRDEVRWGQEHGHLSYAVLNACRALRFATDGTLCSKLDGGQWMLARRSEEPLIQQALADQRQGRVRPMTAEANRFVEQVLDELSRYVEHARPELAISSSRSSPAPARAQGPGVVGDYAGSLSLMEGDYGRGG